MVYLFIRSFDMAFECGLGKLHIYLIHIDAEVNKSGHHKNMFLFGILILHDALCHLFTKSNHNCNHDYFTK